MMQASTFYLKEVSTHFIMFDLELHFCVKIRSIFITQICLMSCLLKLLYIIDFYDPDGYYFNEHGYDEFGGYYDGKGYYHPGPGNKHEFEDLGGDYYEDEDELIKQYERGHADDEDYDDSGTHEHLYKDFVTKAHDEVEIDEELDYSPSKYVETEEEKKEKLLATGSKATERQLEEVKRQKHDHHYKVEEEKKGGNKRSPQK